MQETSSLTGGMNSQFLIDLLLTLVLSWAGMWFLMEQKLVSKSYQDLTLALDQP